MYAFPTHPRGEMQKGFLVLFHTPIKTCTRAWRGRSFQVSCGQMCVRFQRNKKPVGSFLTAGYVARYKKIVRAIKLFRSSGGRMANLRAECDCARGETS